MLSSRQSKINWGAYQPADWASLIQIAVVEGVAPLIFQAFNSDGWPVAIPDALRKALADEFYNTAATNLLLLEEAGRIFACFAVAGIPAIPLKGIDLAGRLYPDVSLRPMGDLDILIRETDYLRAAHLLEESGYVLEDALQNLDPGLRRIVHYEANFNKAVPAPFHVELHWNLIGSQASRYQPQIEWFWQQTTAGQIAGQPVRQLSSNAHLLYCAAHLMIKHGEREQRLIWFYDLRRLLEVADSSLDWALILAQARAFNWLPALVEALQGVQVRFARPLPAALTGIWPDLLVQVETGARENGVTQALTRWQRTLAELSGLDWAARRKLIWFLLFPSAQYMRWRYNLSSVWLLPLYYPYRWLDITGEAWKTLWKWVKRK
ncbi:MAG: nucleotidyltransferase family protein [Anaerolineales bacterium]|nr:nucleotidyltransferase family protein [Anaerolineales bacterium]